MTAKRTLKWRGLGSSEYVSHCGTYLVQLNERNWHLYVRTPSEGAPTRGASWTWSPSVFSHPRKGVCQDFAEGSPKAPDRPRAVPSQSAPRPGLTAWETSSPEHNARCYHCGVPFVRGAYGDLCSRNCLDTVREILTEATTTEARAS